MFEGLEVLDTIRLNFSPDSLKLLNITIAFIMFGVALDLKLSRFKHVVLFPKSTILGVAAQFLVMPLMTFLLVLIINPTPGVALGMILVAACPGGNLSNFMTNHARGNTELSVTLTAISDFSAIIMTPLNFAFWGGLYAKFYHQGSELLLPVEIDILEMVKTMIVILGIPLVIGMLFSKYLPDVTAKIKKPIKILSLFIFASYVVIALAKNFNYFLDYIHLIFLIVLIHNTLAFLSGYAVAKIFKLKRQDVRTITIETGIQNSGLGLVLIFNPNLFNGIGSMAFIAAFWGIWHIISGLTLSSIWSYKPLLNR
ncbi:MAG TPA: symporter [Marinilabiliales bacterium]|nr:MAG: symporter [Bacteroidetes bacterium GWA2_40_14]OFX56607.1 MAG: symporter [Bacteroidetes bacterium GWC2_40_13]OFX71827.1 MAG: symporter [Bacteroidetes bacterium GWD2_40_43]OFX94625.1 MAG: symporter [Bacteroidetes bacterium GWE2_40_63]OFY22413.1 MAG: symporter [Bacteroidetes bacterium GWF2_40_13]OFZ24391.1 MAG: symporter [Bacteroidetes bacterium RIFOXYC2_FULL_40_12]HAM98391.1 symporter [Marinilabiliales bacterium]